MDRKRLMTLLIGFTGLVVLGVPPSTRADEDRCTVATLHGEYLFTGRADNPGAAVNVLAGIFTFDGAGRVSSRNTASIGGVIRKDQRFDGTYTVNPDCVGEAQVGPAHYDIFIGSEGTVAEFVRTDDKTVATRSLRKR